MTDSQTVEAYTQTLSNNGFVCPQSATICYQVSANLLPALGMLGRDPAKLYQVKPIRLREQVKRNKKRFPADFMFQLTRQEWHHLRWQSGTSSSRMVSQSAIPSRQHLGASLKLLLKQGKGRSTHYVPFSAHV
jgi:hypothetical protein